MKSLLLVLLTVVLAACTPPASETPADHTEIEPPQPSGPPAPDNLPEAITTPAAAPAWEMITSGEGVTLRYDQDGKPVMSIACLTQPSRLIAQGPSIERIASEERLSLGIGEEAVTLVAELGRAGPGVTGEGAAPPELQRLLDAAGQVSLVYGARTIGPVPAPADEQKKALAEACAL